MLDTGSLTPDEYARNLQFALLILLSFVFIEDGVELDERESFALYVVIMHMIKLGDSWEQSI